MYIQGSAEYEHHRRTYGSQDQFGYKDFIPRFTADRFDADEWADLFKRAGAGFVVPVAEHHDGFAMYYNKAAEFNRQVVINYKFDAFEKGTAVYDMKRGGLASIQPHVWQTCTSIGKTAWCHISNPDYKTAAFLIGDLIDIVSKNGVMLLNVGPRADGTIAQEEQHILLDIGKWLHVNGEAIYGTKPWKIHGEGPTEVVDGTFNDTRRTAYTGADIRFTTRNGYLYVLLLGWPQDGNAVITSLSITGWYEGQIASVHILGVDEQPVWQRTEAGLEVPLPPQLAEQPAIVLKITAL